MLNLGHSPGEHQMLYCEYDAREITTEPYKVRMKRRGQLASAMGSKPSDESADLPEIGYAYFHDVTCYELFVADEVEYDAVDLPGSEIG